MTIEELKIEADKLGYNLTKKPESSLVVENIFGAVKTGRLSLTISFA